MGLEHIANVAADIRRHRTPGELTIASSVTFASYWLMAQTGAEMVLQEPHLPADGRLADPQLAGRRREAEIAGHGLEDYQGIDRR